MLFSSVASSACSRTSDTCWRRRPSSASTSSMRRSASACAAWRDLMTSICCSRLRRSSSSVSRRGEPFAAALVPVRRASCARGRPPRPLRRTTRARPAASGAARPSAARRRSAKPCARCAAAGATISAASRSISYCCDCAVRIEVREQVFVARRAVGEAGGGVDGVAEALVARQRPQIETFEPEPDEPQPGIDERAQQAEAPRGRTSWAGSACRAAAR